MTFTTHSSRPCRQGQFHQCSISRPFPITVNFVQEVERRRLGEGLSLSSSTPASASLSPCATHPSSLIFTLPIPLLSLLILFSPMRKLLTWAKLNLVKVTATLLRVPRAPDLAFSNCPEVRKCITVTPFPPPTPLNSPKNVSPAPSDHLTRVTTRISESVTRIITMAIHQ